MFEHVICYSEMASDGIHIAKDASTWFYKNSLPLYDDVMFIPSTKFQ